VPSNLRRSHLRIHSSFLTTKPQLLPSASTNNLLAHLSTGSPGGLIRQFSKWHRRNLDVNSDPFQQWPADASKLAFDLLRSTAAGPSRITSKSAGARIHRHHQHHIGRKCPTVQSPRDRDRLILQRLTQYLHGPTIEFRQLVKKQNPVVCQTDLTRLRNAATSPASLMV
jgi:hypothetical protein